MYNNGELSLDSLQLGAPRDAVHTLDDRRREALRKVDEASFSLFHVKVCLVAGAGFFTDAYDIFAISIASTMLGYIYGIDSRGHKRLSWAQDLGLKIATPTGNLFGQVFFGWLADVFGRKRMYGIELMIIIVGTLGQAISGSALAIDFLGPLIFWRVVMGVGVGGDYPLSAIITSEFSATRIRGRLMTTVFAAQGWGNFAACIVAIVTVAGYKGSLQSEDLAVQNASIDKMWRILIGMGCVPAAIALFFRLTIPETPRFTMDIERNVQQAAKDVEGFLDPATFIVDPDVVVQRVEAPQASRRDFVAHFRVVNNFKILFATCWCWFAIDVVFYGVGLNSSEILPAIGFGDATNTYRNLRQICIGNIVLAVGGLIPGYYASFLLIDSWGRKPIQLLGFGMITVLFIVIAGAATSLLEIGNSSAPKALFFLYCLANFFNNFGPNTTTFIIPGEVFPTRYRSTAHGISAAFGKLGAVITQIVFAYIKKSGDTSSNLTGDQLKKIAAVYVVFSATGFLATFLLPETKNRSLEDLSNEDQQGFVKGVATQVEVRDGVILDYRKRAGF